jgi:transposase
MPRPNKYPPEFRREVVELVRSSDKTIAQVAKELGLNRETVRCWVRRDQADRGERRDLLSTAEQQELARLRRENAELRMERELLKAAAAFSPRRRPGDPLPVRPGAPGSVRGAAVLPGAGRLHLQLLPLAPPRP